MEVFQGAHFVRLRSRVRRSMSLVAEDDCWDIGLSGHRAANNTMWAVKLVADLDGGPFLLLGSYGRYIVLIDLEATTGPSHGVSAVQHGRAHHPTPPGMQWQAIRNTTGCYLRANGRNLRWRALVTVAGDSASSMMQWAIEVVPCRLGRPTLVDPPAQLMQLRVTLGDRPGQNRDALHTCLCVGAGRFARLSPLLIDLPIGDDSIDTVVISHGTAGARRGRLRAGALVPEQLTGGGYAAAATCGVRLVLHTLCTLWDMFVGWVVSCAGRRRGPREPPLEWSWREVMGAPIVQPDDGSCTISSCTMCIEAQHRLAFERLHGKGTFTFKAKSPGDLKATCRKKGAWSPEMGAPIEEVLDIIAQGRGIPTQRVPNSVYLPIKGHRTFRGARRLEPMAAARFLFSKGPMVGALFVDKEGDYDSCNADNERVYRGPRTGSVERPPANHAVVCFAYRFMGGYYGGELQFRIMDNHEDAGPMRWVSYDTIEYMYLPLIEKPLDCSLLRRRKKRQETGILSHVSERSSELVQEIRSWLIREDMSRYL